jgi:hypothetical protein
MADPLSIVAGAVGIAEVCQRVTNYLKDVKAAAATVEDDINSFIHEVEALATVNQSIKKAFAVDIARSNALSPLKSTHLETLWQRTGKSIEDCQAIVSRLEDVVKQIFGKTGPKVIGKIDGLSKLSRKREKAAELRQIRDQLSTCQSSLQILLTGINVYASTLYSLVEVPKQLRS